MGAQAQQQRLQLSVACSHNGGGPNEDEGSGGALIEVLTGGCLRIPLCTCI